MGAESGKGAANDNREIVLMSSSREASLREVRPYFVVVAAVLSQ